MKRLLMIVVVIGVSLSVFYFIKNYSATHRGGINTSSYSSPSAPGKFSQLTSSFKNWKQGLPVVAQIAVSVGLVFLALLGFIAAVIMFFVLIMVIQRK